MRAPFRRFALAAVAAAAVDGALYVSDDSAGAIYRLAPASS
jgi:glucose/arabinose dehydrogenase